MALTKVTSGVRTLGTGEVVTANINDGDVTTAKMATDPTNASNLASGTLPIARVADNAVTLAKLEDGTQGDILYYSKKRATPTITQYSAGVTGWFLHYENTSSVVASVPTFDMIDSKTCRITATVASGLTQGESAYLRTGNTADSYIIVSSEL